MSFTLDGSKPYYEVNHFEQVDDDSVLECLKHFFAAPELPAGDLLVDYSGVTDFQVTMPGIRRLTDFVNSRIPELERNPNRRVAYVLPSDVEYGMGRVFLATIDTTCDSQLFRRRSEALGWLGTNITDELPSAC